MADTPGGDHRFVTIDVAALALDVSKPHAYFLARTEGWRRTRQKPYEYSLIDIRTTQRRRST